MKIGMIYYSKTGHTAQLAEKAAEQLLKSGYEVDTHRLETIAPLSMSAERAAVKEMPAIGDYDALAVGTPVHGGRISAPVLTFMENTPSFEEKPVVFFLTHIFPTKLSAHITIDALEKLGSEKNGQVLGSVDVTWFSFSRKKQVRDAAAEIVTLFEIEN